MSQIRTIRQNSATIFGKISEAELERQMNTLKYIELVAMQANIPLADWNILEVFKAKKGSNKLVTAPKEINKRLFAAHQVNKELIQRASLQDVMSKEKAIKSNYKRYVSNSTSSAQTQLESFKISLKSAQESGDNFVVHCTSRKIAELERQIARGLEADRIYKDIGRVVMNGFWKFIGSNGTKLRFITTSNIILFDKNVKSKMNLQKDFGTFLCKVDIRTLQATIHCWKDNTVHSRDYIHPYVSCNDICFGNAQEAATNARQEGDLYKLMNIVGMVIGTYNGAEGPHIALVNFINLPNNRAQHRVDFTAEAKKYYADLQPVKDPLKEFMQEVGDLKKVGNTLATSIGRHPEDAADQENDDELYPEDMEDDESDEGYF